MKRTLLIGAVLGLAALALAAAYFYIPEDARPVFDEGEVRVCLNEDGSILLDWPEAHPRVSQDVLTKLSPDAVRRALSGLSAVGLEKEEAADLLLNSVGYHVTTREEGAQPQKHTQYSPGVTLAEGFSLPLTVQIQAEGWGANLLGLPRRALSKKLTAEIAPVSLSAPKALGAPGPGKLSLSWEQPGEAPDFYEIFTLDETGKALHAATASEKEAELTVRKKDGDLLLPGYGHPLEVQVRAGVRREGYVLCGPASNTVSVERQDLLGDDLNLLWKETEPRMFTLEWDETRGEYYELQEWTPEGWTLLDTLEPAESFTYELGRLGSGSRHRFQVVAKDGGGGVRSSEEAEFFASVDPLYATVWPIIDQPYYERADGESASLGKIPGGTALCVLEEQGDWFQVRYKDQTGWVDSRFCMINLPEYVGDHCAYDITNSYRSLFKVHENPIALITDQVVQGFEHIQEADGHFLVPYLYPCSKKLLSAAQAAEQDGYRLKIYEAFRPNEATRFLYDTTAAQLDWAALVYSTEDAEGRPLGPNEDPRVLDPVTGWEVDLSDGLLIDPETEEKISREDLALRQEEEAAQEGQGEPPAVPDPDSQFTLPTPPPGDDIPFFTLPEEGEGGSLDPAEPASPPEEPQAAEPAPQPPISPEAPAEAPEESQEGEAPEEEEPEYDTYFSIMTNNGRFHLGSFLARVTSAHNRGIALDLTLETIGGGEELEMQSAIHDLSWYSAAYLNNDNAKLLEKYMTGAGMRGLSSEWWHFQDDETREAIGLSSYLFKGVDMGGWTKDDRGWRYRDADGSIFRNTTVTVDGKRYAADQDGYIQE